MLPGIYSGSVISPAKDFFSFTRMYFKDKTKSVKFCEICGTFMGVQDMTSGTPTFL